MHMYVYVHVYEHVCASVLRPEEGVRSPRAGVTGGYELPKVDAGNWTLSQHEYTFLTTKPSFRLLVLI